MALSKAGQLIKNTGILAIGNFSSKLLVFLMVPLYTATLSTGEYGAYDIISSSVSLLVPILTLNVQDALLRFPMEDGADVPRIARFGLGITLASSVMVLVAQLAPNAPWSDLTGIVWLAPLYSVSAFYQALVTLSRSLERMRDIAVAGVTSSAVTVGLNVLLLVWFGWGLNGYFISSVLGMALPALWLAFRMRHVIVAPTKSRGNSLALRMVRYSLPLAFTTIGWWFISTSDRYIVLAFCGVEANGLYSAAYKIPSILSTVANIFFQAWQVAAVKGFDPKDADGFLRHTFWGVETGVLLLCSLMIPLSPFIARILFSGEFYEAWVYVPLLLVYSAVNSMTGMWSPFFSASYDPAPMAVSTFAGGIVNVATGVPLTMALGVRGACFSSALAGMVNWGIRAYCARRHLSFSVRPFRSVVASCLLFLQALPISYEAITGFSMAFQAICIVLLLLLYRKETVGIARRVFKLITRQGATRG